MNSNKPAVSETDIAIVGMACRVPGAKNVRELWQNLSAGLETTTFFSDDELLARGIEEDILRDPRYVKASSRIDDIDLFDASFFDINPREASLIDPQSRLFVECAYEALEDAGYNPDTYPGPIGVFGGAGTNTYLLHNLYPSRNVLVSTGLLPLVIANDKDYLTTRVSYLLNLKGPSFNVQTACSTSLVAVHLGCQSLINGEATLALAGGVAVDVTPDAGYFYQEGSIFSPDGHCRPFDHRARGTLFGSGVGLVVLKRLVDALRDGDTVHAVIKGSAINNDGSQKAGYRRQGWRGRSRSSAQRRASRECIQTPSATSRPTGRAPRWGTRSSSPR